MCVTGRNSTPDCAATGNTERQRSPRPPTTADAVILVAFLICTPRERARCLRRRDREANFAGQRLVRDLVGDLDLEPVVPFGERRQGDCLPALELVAGRQVELRRQRLRVQILRVRLVEELLRLTGGLLVEVVLPVDVRL